MSTGIPPSHSSDWLCASYLSSSPMGDLARILEIFFFKKSTFLFFVFSLLWFHFQFVPVFHLYYIHPVLPALCFCGYFSALSWVSGSHFQPFFAAAQWLRDPFAADLCFRCAPRAPECLSQYLRRVFYSFFFVFFYCFLFHS